MQISIHPYSNEYRDKVPNLICSIQREEFGIDITLDDQPDLKNIGSFYQKGKGNFWMAFVNEELAGTIALLDIDNHQGALRKMFVKAKFRGREYGVVYHFSKHYLTGQRKRTTIKYFWELPKNS